jgi:uncharacterized surface protein with fasciclin (FAS1) repeats
MTARAAAGVALLLLAPATRAADRGTLYETLVGEEKLAVLAVAAKEAGGVEALSGKDEWTLFAPTDAAFKRLGELDIVRIAESKDAVKRLFRAHLVKGRFGAADLKKMNGMELPAADGTRLKVEDRADGLYVGGVKLASELPCRNGVIHVLDAVLPLPKE